LAGPVTELDMRGALVAVLLLVGLAGCADEAEQVRRLCSPVPQERFDAVIWLAEHGSEARLPRLIKRREDEDPSVRWAACQALKERTGETFDYRPGDPEPRRLEAVKEWRDWWHKQSGAEVGERTAGGADSEATKGDHGGRSPTADRQR